MVIATIAIEFKNMGAHLAPLVKQLVKAKLGHLKVVPAVGKCST